MAYEFTRKTDNVDDVMAVDVNELQEALEAHEFLTLKAATELTIASGAITAVQASHKLQPESLTADDLDTINGMDAGDILVLYVSDAGVDTITIKHGTGNISCLGGSDVKLSEGAAIFYSDGTTVYLIGGGAGGISNSSISPTTANVSAAVNTRYFADISGLTADRNFVVPAGTAGDVIELNLTVGDASYELIIIGDTGITINGGSAATEWSRLFITGEYIKLIATSATNWQVVVDKRIPCKCRIKNSQAQSIGTASATSVTLDEEVFDVGDISNEGSNKIVVRRTGYYSLSAAAQFATITANRVFLSIFVAGATVARAEQSANTNGYPSMNPTTVYQLATDNSVYLQIYQDSGGSKDISVSVFPPFLVVTEIL